MIVTPVFILIVTVIVTLIVTPIIILAHLAAMNGILEEVI